MFGVLVRKLVEFETVCKAAEVLFKNIGRKSKYFPAAIDYMINSPKIDPTETYSCGDAELETLLNLYCGGGLGLPQVTSS